MPKTLPCITPILIGTASDKEELILNIWCQWLKGLNQASRGLLSIRSEWLYTSKASEMSKRITETRHPQLCWVRTKLKKSNWKVMKDRLFRNTCLSYGLWLEQTIVLESSRISEGQKYSYFDKVALFAQTDLANSHLFVGVKLIVSDLLVRLVYRESDKMYIFRFTM